MPDLSTAVLAAARGDITRTLGADYLPAESIGVGNFAEVYATALPDVVCKVTLDGSEAFLAEALAAHPRLARLPGLPRYTAAPLRVERGGEPVWLLWCKRVGPPLLADTREQMRKSIYQKPAGKSFKDFERQLRNAEREAVRTGYTDFERLDAANQCGLSIASAAVEPLPHLAAFQRELDAAMPQARDEFKAKQSVFGWEYGPKHERGFVSLALELLGYRYQLEWLARGKIMPALARSCLALLDEGILLCDLRDDNVSDGTLFDGGFALPLNARWNALWTKVAPRAERWFSHNAGRAAVDAWGA